MFSASNHLSTVSRTDAPRKSGGLLAGLFTQSTRVVVAAWLCFVVPMALAGLACAWQDVLPGVHPLLLNAKVHGLALVLNGAGSDPSSIFHAWTVASRSLGVGVLT